MIAAPVVVIGGGPVGLTLGIDLARRGQRCILVEERTGPPDHPKATLLGARSMEMYRRWGLDDAIYAAAVPADNPYYIIFTTRLAGQELHPVPFALHRRDPSARARRRGALPRTAMVALRQDADRPAGPGARAAPIRGRPGEP